MTQFIIKTISKFYIEKEKFYIKESNLLTIVPKNLLIWNYFNSLFKTLLIVYILLKAYFVDSPLTYYLGIFVFSTIVGKTVYNILLMKDFLKSLLDDDESLDKKSKFLFKLLGFFHMFFYSQILLLSLCRFEIFASILDFFFGSLVSEAYCMDMIEETQNNPYDGVIDFAGAAPLNPEVHKEVAKATVKTTANAVVNGTIAAAGTAGALHGADLAKAHKIGGPHAKASIIAGSAVAITTILDARGVISKDTGKAINDAVKAVNEE